MAGDFVGDQAKNAINNINIRKDLFEKGVSSAEIFLTKIENNNNNNLQDSIQELI